MRMFKLIDFSKKAALAVAVTALGMSCFSAFAQDYDDIYYNPAKDKTKTEKLTNKQQQPQYQNYTPQFTDYTAAGDIVVNYGSTRDVDEYNRRGGKYEKQQNADSLQNEDEFLYTRRIEKFHNPDVVINTNDNDLIDYYYETQPRSASVVNIYVNDTPNWAWYRPYYYNWAWSPYYYNSFWDPYWSWNYYSPWYSWTWGPSWSWGPSWAWGPSWSWGWHPGWNPGPNHGWTNNWRPTVTSPGASRPHNIAHNTPAGATVRPGSMSAPNNRPAGVGSASVPSASGNRGRFNTGTLTNNGNRWPNNINNNNIVNKNNPGKTTGVPSRPGTVNTVPPSNNKYTGNSNNPPRTTNNRSNFSTGGSNSYRPAGGGGGSYNGGAGGGGRGRR